ncbi:synapsin-like, partial [Pollicipes pollicipes]|uniref:synapsin-like n=1 Tax=Pollicipes pollicipes TaxID=41117 RepID=UPI001884EAA1
PPDLRSRRQPDPAPRRRLSCSGGNQKPAKIASFLSFKQSFTANVSNLKRRFSSGDLASEYEDGDEVRQRQADVVGQPAAAPTSSGPAPQQQQHHQQQGPPPQHQQHQQPQQEGSGFSFGTFRPGGRTTSAPSSPSKTRESFLQRVQSLTSGVTRPDGPLRQTFNKDRCFTLLVIDDQNTDWSKYFKGRQIHGDYDIRVEQAEFGEISVSGSTEAGTHVTMVVYRGGTRVVRSFKPHFVLVRQNLRDASEDHKNLLLGFKYGDIPSINSLQSIYNFQDKPWVFAHLLQLQRRLGKEAFPLIDQAYFPNHKDMLSNTKFPVVFKVGHAHNGAGKVRVESPNAFQDMASVVGVSGVYCTTEPFIDAKYDLHIQKIGNNYKAFMRKSISGNWKTNVGSAMLEQQPLTERHRSWISAVAQLFGGLDICALEAVVGKDGREHIIEVNDSALTLMGDSQEEDRRHIADLVCAKMQHCCKPAGAPGPEEPPATSAPNGSTLANESPSPGKRRDSQASQASSSVSGVSSPSAGRTIQQTSSVDASRTGLFGRQGSVSQGDKDDTEDTMTNLRKTFAGIFGDM